MSIEVSKGKRAIVRATDVIDYLNVGELNRALEEAARECPQGFIIDLSEATYMDSAGVQAVIYAYKLVVPRGGVLAVIVQNPNTRDILRITGVERLPGFHLCDDLSRSEEIVPECRSEASRSDE